MAKHEPMRLVIYTKDVEVVLGCKDRTARKVLQNIRKLVGKRPREYVSIEEFCQFTKLTEQRVREMMMGCWLVWLLLLEWPRVNLPDFDDWLSLLCDSLRCLRPM